VDKTIFPFLFTSKTGYGPELFPSYPTNNTYAKTAHFSATKPTPRYSLITFQAHANNSASPSSNIANHCHIKRQECGPELFSEK